MPSPDVITVSQLARLVGTPDAPTIMDVSLDSNFDGDPHLIPTAFRYPVEEITVFAGQAMQEKVVVVCPDGLSFSQGAASLLRASGVAAEALEGGKAAWRDAGLPLVPATRIPARDNHDRTIWVTRHRPKIDRIACPWLIRRFVDPGAQFLFVAPAEVTNVAERFNATPFDVEGVFWSHRGDCCTFDTMIEEFDLRTEPLLRLATIVRGADTNRHDLAPQAAGLLAASLGLSRMHKDDLRQLQAGMSLYDAFYRWSRDAVQESHDWPSALARSS